MRYEQRGAFRLVHRKRRRVPGQALDCPMDEQEKGRGAS